MSFIVKPFGKALNQDLLEMFSPEKLDLSEALTKELKASAVAR